MYESPSGSVCENGHGGAEYFDEIPKCPNCSEELNPEAVFCHSCGESLQEEQEQEEEGAVRCEDCGEAIPDSANFCPACGSKSEEEVEEEFDFSKIDPRTDWECFGQIDMKHPECMDCPFNKECAEEAGVTL